ncbi:MAG: hypothetical protein ACT4NV_04615 [Rhodoferax sp.]
MDLQALVVQRPTTAAQLVLLFHGADSDAQAMRGCALALAAAFPQALVASIQGPHPGTLPHTHGWLPVQAHPPSGSPGAAPLPPGTPDATAASAGALAASLALMVQAVHYWQSHTGLDAAATALVGFGQGATLVLESTLLEHAPAQRVVAMAGHYAALPTQLSYRGSIHFLHGKADTVVPYRHTVEAAHRVRDLGGDLTAEVLPFIGHELHPDFVASAVERLSTHVSRFVWEEALQHPDPPADPAR